MTRASARKAAGRLLTLLLAILLAGPALAAGCREGAIDLRAPDGAAARFEVEIADDPAERARGLMHRESMAAGHGMLFLWEEAAPRSFWMKNTPLPLDLIFFDPAGRVLNVIAEATPYSTTPLPSEGPAVAVLEINGGLAARYGLGAGAEARHPAFAGPQAAWPCP